MSHAVDSSEIRRLARHLGTPLTDAILAALGRRDQKSTLLAVCPNSESVTKAAIVAGMKANAPVLYAATLNQVDCDGGYTGWTQDRFVDIVRAAISETGFDGPVVVALDHGGPWLKDKQTTEQWSYEKAMAGVKKSLEACLDAGYDLLHIDPTVDRTLSPDTPISIETVIDRTVEMICYAETYRRDKSYPAVSYEVGTEEVHGGLADMKVFRRFLEGLGEGLRLGGFPNVWPCFVVGKVGTDLHTTLFDPDVATELVREAGVYGSYIKGHYSDSVENPEDYPAAGMGGANVGPEFTEAEYEALSHLVAVEKDVDPAETSDFMETLEQAVIDSGRWKKWRQPDESGLDFDQFMPERKQWLVRTGCRYVWTDPKVLAARAKLYANLEDAGHKPENVVIDRIVECICSYYEAFNLENGNDVIEYELRAMVSAG